MVVMVMRLVMHASRISTMTIRTVDSLIVLTVLIVHHLTLALPAAVANTMVVSVVRSTTELNAPFTTVSHR